MTPISRVRELGSKRPTYESAYGRGVRPVELPEQLEGTVGGESQAARGFVGVSTGQAFLIPLGVASVSAG